MGCMTYPRQGNDVLTDNHFHHEIFVQKIYLMGILQRDQGRVKRRMLDRLADHVGRLGQLQNPLTAPSKALRVRLLEMTEGLTRVQAPQSGWERVLHYWRIRHQTPGSSLCQIQCNQCTVQLAFMVCIIAK